MTYYWISGIIIYLSFWIWTWGTLLAYMQASYPSLKEWKYRQDLSLSCGLSLLLTSWIVVLFLTGFYQNGWRLSK